MGKFTGGVYKPARVSEEEVIAGGEASLQAGTLPGAAPTLPSEQPTPVPTQTTEAAPEEGVAQPGDAISLALERLAAARGEPVASPVRAEQVTDETAPFTTQQAQAVPERVGQVSPEREQVIQIPRPRPDTVAEEGVKPPEFLSVEEAAAEYDVEQQRQRRMTIGDIDQAIVGLGTDSEATYDSASQEVALKLQEQVDFNPRVNEVFRLAGALDQNNKVKPEAARSVLFVMASKAHAAERAKADGVADLQQQLEAGEIDINNVDENLQYIVNKPDFDKYNMQGTFAHEFSQIFQGLEGAEQEGRIANPQGARSGLSTQDQAIVAETIGHIFSGRDEQNNIINPDGLGFFREVSRKNPTTGAITKGYMLGEDFVPLLSSIYKVLDTFLETTRKGVTFTPNVGGVVSGHKALLHQQTTRSVKKAKAKKGSEVYQALDAAGTTPNAVNKAAMGNQVGVLTSILMSDTRDGNYGFYTHPLAESFLLGRNTFEKHLKTSVAEFDAEVNNALSRVAHAFPGDPAQQKQQWANMSVRELSELLGAFRTPAGAASNVTTSARTANGEPIYMDGFQQLMELKIQLANAKAIQRQVYQSYRQAAVEGLDVGSRTFYYPYTLIAGNSRMMVDTTELNFQANKKARALVANPIAHLVIPNKRDQLSNQGFRMVVARILGHEYDSDRAPSNKALLDIFEQIEGNNEIRQMALFMADSQISRTELSNYQKAVADERSKTDIYKDKSKPGDRTFPSLGRDPFNGNFEMLARIAKFAEFDKGKSDEGDFMMNALIEYGKWLQGRPFHTQLTAEGDGINNGLAIQGYQFGEQNILERGGVLYDSETSATPLGDMRDLIQEQILGPEASVLPIVYANPDDVKLWTKVFEIIAGKVEGFESKVKDLHKYPVMTTPFGNDADYHGGTIKEKFLDPNPDLVAELKRITGLDDAALLENLAKIEGEALRKGLGTAIDHSAIIKRAHDAAVAANELLVVKGANGWDITVGGIDYEIQSVEELEFSDGIVERILTKKPVGTPAARARQKGPDHAPKKGSRGANQLAVFPTHNGDATVAQRTIVNTKAEMGDTFWGVQVFDAFIGDVMSYPKLMDTANAEFDRLNKDFLMIENEIEAIKDLRRRVQAKVAEAKKHPHFRFDVTEGGEYDGLYQQLKRISLSRSQKPVPGTEQHSRSARRYARRQAQGSKINFRVDGSQMTPDQFMAAWEHVIKDLEIESVMQQFKQRVLINQDKIKRRKAQQRGQTSQYR